MSWRAVAWAIEQETGSATRKWVLVALADRHNGDTGRCDPRIRRLAADTELSERSVQRALAELEERGFIERHERYRDDGGRRSDLFTFPALAGEGVAVSPPPGDTESGQEPGSSEPGTSVANAPDVQGQRHWRVDRKVVTPAEDALALAVLAVWNEHAGQELRARGWLAKIVMRIREYPEATLADHAHIIHANLARPWWSGAPTPSVVYGSDAQFERAITTARLALEEGADEDERLARIVEDATRRRSE